MFPVYVPPMGPDPARSRAFIQCHVAVLVDMYLLLSGHDLQVRPPQSARYTMVCLWPALVVPHHRMRDDKLDLVVHVGLGVLLVHEPGVSHRVVHQHSGDDSRVRERTVVSHRGVQISLEAFTQTGFCVKSVSPSSLPSEKVDDGILEFGVRTPSPAGR